MTVHHSEDCGECRKYEYRYIRTRKIRFSIKASSDAGLCLSSHDHDESDMYQIFIGCWGGGESGIRRGKDQDVLRVQTPDILCPEEFREFWVTVNRGKIKVGKKGKRGAFMTFEDPDKLEDVKYYGFCTGWGVEGDWMFKDEKEGSSSSSSSSSSSAASSSDSEAEELNGLEQRPIMYKRPARWVFGAGGYLPRHPIAAGHNNGGTVYVGMAKHEDGHILGTVVPEENVCYIPFGGEAIAKEEYYVLGNPGKVEMEWKEGSGGKVPPGALEGGFSEDNEPLFVGRVLVNGEGYCGKVHPSHQVCYVPYNGAEQAYGVYEVLCVKGLPCRFRV